MKTKIVCSEDFGLGFNCLTRRYKFFYEDVLLELMIRTCDEYLKYFSTRTLLCSLRSLAPNSCDNDEPVPAWQEERYNKLFKGLFRQYVTLERRAEKKKRLFRAAVLNAGIDLGLVKTEYGIPLADSKEKFEYWIERNGLYLPAEVVEHAYDQPIPIKRKYKNDFNEICIQMLEYSLDRRNYMPYTTIGFIIKNADLITTGAWQEIDRIVSACGWETLIVQDSSWLTLRRYMEQVQGYE